MAPINRDTKLSELHARCESLTFDSSSPTVPSRLVASVEQSMRAEGHVLSREHFERETLRGIRALQASSK